MNINDVEVGKTITFRYDPTPQDHLVKGKVVKQTDIWVVIKLIDAPAWMTRELGPSNTMAFDKNGVHVEEVE